MDCEFTPAKVLGPRGLPDVVQLLGPKGVVLDP